MTDDEILAIPVGRLVAMDSTSSSGDDLVRGRPHRKRPCCCPNPQEAGFSEEQATGVVEVLKEIEASELRPKPTLENLAQY
jgi:hypothetical protein